MSRQPSAEEVNQVRDALFNVALTQDFKKLDAVVNDLDKQYDLSRFPSKNCHFPHPWYLALALLFQAKEKEAFFFLLPKGYIKLQMRFSVTHDKIADDDDAEQHYFLFMFAEIASFYADHAVINDVSSIEKNDNQMILKGIVIGAARRGDLERAKISLENDFDTSCSQQLILFGLAGGNHWHLMKEISSSADEFSKKNIIEYYFFSSMVFFNHTILEKMSRIYPSHLKMRDFSAQIASS